MAEKLPESVYYKRLAGGPMAIEFRSDVDRVLQEATSAHRPVLLDFSAAPM
jgi:hypothetical protein